jgi:hypothetical protein
MAFPSNRGLLENLITDPYVGFLFRCYSDPSIASLDGTLPLPRVRPDAAITTNNSETLRHLAVLPRFW